MQNKITRVTSGAAAERTTTRSNARNAAAHSLRSDNLGKTIAAQLLRMEVEVPDELAAKVLDGARLAIERM